MSSAGPAELGGAQGGRAAEENLLAAAYLSRVAEPASVPLWMAVPMTGPSPSLIVQPDPAWSMLEIVLFMLRNARSVRTVPLHAESGLQSNVASGSALISTQSQRRLLW